ncbi:MAG: AMP-binding protein [Pseudomonadota bacterium]
MSTYHPLTLAGMVAEKCETHPDLVVLTIEGAGVRPDETRTYRELWQNGQRLAGALRQQGLQRGEMFALLLANHAEFVDAMMAAALLGAVFVPIDPRTRGDKLAYSLAAANCRGVIAADYALAALQEVRARVSSLAWVICLGTDEGAPPMDGALDYQAALAPEGSSVPVPECGPDEAMQLIYTSGTTGDPKGIVMTHRRYCETAALAPRLFGYRSDDRPYSGLSLTHANAQLVTLGAALAGGLRCVLSRRFTKSRLWDITRRYGCTSFSLLGGMTTAVYAEAPRPDDADNPVRFVVSAGMPAAIWHDFEQRFGVQILEFYGAAEGGLTIKPVGVGPAGSIGKPIPTLAYRIVDEAGHDVAPGQPGELLFRAANDEPFRVQYFGNAAASDAKCAGGWLHMGDVVHEDAQGWLYFEYRKGAGIRRNGDFVNTAYIEKVLAECQDIDDAYVYGIAAASGAPGEKDVVAAIVPRDARSFDAQRVFRTCRDQLEPNFVPSLLQVLAHIPKTASEKPQERFLLDALQTNPASVHREA